MDYRVLGPMEVRVDGVALPLGGPKQRVVVAILVAAAGRPVPVDVLLEAIYGEDVADGGRRTLQTYVSNLRQALGDVIVRQGDAYSLTCTELVDRQRDVRGRRTATATAMADAGRCGDRACAARWRCGVGTRTPTSRLTAPSTHEFTRLSELRLAALEARDRGGPERRPSSRGRRRAGRVDRRASVAREPARHAHAGAVPVGTPDRGVAGVRAHAGGVGRRSRDRSVAGAEGVSSGGSSSRIAACCVAGGPSVQRRAVLVADLDDPRLVGPMASARAPSPAASGSWPPLPTAREVASWRPRARPGTRCSPSRSTPFASPVRSVDGRTTGGGRLRRPRGRRRRAGRSAARSGGAPRRCRPPRPGVAVGRGSRRADERRVVRLGGGVAGALRHRRSRPGSLIYQLVGQGFASEFPALRLDRLPPSMPRCDSRVGAGVRAAGADRRGRAR